MIPAVCVCLLSALAIGLLLPFSRAREWRPFWPAAFVFALACGFSLAVALVSAAGDEKAPAKSRPEGEPVRKQLVKPKNWPEGHPLPLVGSNCVACHLTAGRELTAAVQNFARSAHDLHEMTCYDCHGGNTRDDVRAHEEEFGFIGTKKSAHIAHCGDCHAEEAETLASGPHHWDFGKRINTEYPMCFDCHGNHDVGNPPADFQLVAMCGDCHEKMDKEFPQLASVVKQNDRLWNVLRQVRKHNVARPEPVPTQFQAAVAGLRADTMQIVHASREIPADKATALNRRAETLRTEMEKWLQSAQ